LGRVARRQWRHGGGPGGNTPGNKPAVTVQSLSSPEKMTSGDDTLIQLTSIDGNAVAGVKVVLNDKDVTDQFKKAPNGNASLGLLTGLAQGENTIEVRDAADASKVRGSLKLTAYPVQGPILYAPQEGSFHCQTDTFNIYPGGPTLTAGPNTDANCAAPTRIDWVYHDATKTAPPSGRSTTRPTRRPRSRRRRCSTARACPTSCGSKPA
jgi:hypothetical protein